MSCLDQRRGPSNTSRVAEDVRQGYVTIEVAARDYGVVIDPATGAVDEEETERRRAEMRSSA